MKIAGYYGDPARAGLPRAGVAYIDERRATAYMPSAVPVLWAPEAPSAEAGVVTAGGKRGLFAFNNSGCPRNPQVAGHLKRRLARVRALGYGKAVLDELNYPTPHDGELFHSCFCEYCTSEEPGLEALRLKLDLGGLAAARARLVERALKEAADYAEALGLRLEAVVHPPIIAKLAGQDYRAFLKYVDKLQVMLYHKCPGAGCLNREYAMLMRLTGEDPYGLGDPDKVEREGVPMWVLEREAKEARRLGGDRAVPVLWADERLGQAMEAVAAAGFDEAVVFVP